MGFGARQKSIKTEFGRNGHIVQGIPDRVQKVGDSWFDYASFRFAFYGFF